MCRVRVQDLTPLSPLTPGAGQSNFQADRLGGHQRILKKTQKFSLRGGAFREEQ